MAGGLSNFLSKILGGSVSGSRERAGGTTAAPAAEDYNGYTIRPAPFQDRGQWITSAVIEKRFGEVVKQHRFIRADMYPGQEAAAAASVMQLIWMIMRFAGDRR